MRSNGMIRVPEDPANMAIYPLSLSEIDFPVIQQVYWSFEDWIWNEQIQ